MPLTYARLADHFQGISLSLDADQMLFPGPIAQEARTIRELLKEAVEKIGKKECEKKGLTEDKLVTMPRDTPLDPESEEIWINTLKEIDRTKQF